MLATNSAAASTIIAEALKAQTQHRLFRVINYTRIDKAASQSPTARVVFAAWKASVPVGAEEAVLRELEFRVSRGLEREGGYEGIDPWLSLSVTRGIVAAHQTPRIILSSVVAGHVEQSVDLQSTHERYKAMMGINRTDATNNPVTVAILDSGIRMDALDPGIAGRISIGPVAEVMRAVKPQNHGTATAAVVGDVAPNASIISFPIKGTDEYVAALDALQEVPGVGARVVSMCFEVGSARRDAPRQRVMNKILQGLGEDVIVVASSGNRSRPRDALAKYPGIAPTVVMVGSVDADYRLSDFSCYELAADRPALYLCAPGGRGQEPFVEEWPVQIGSSRITGTSISAAYAAGVIARSLGAVDSTISISGLDFLRCLDRFADKECSGNYAAINDVYGSGIIRVVPPSAIAACAVPIGVHE